jgi:small conductance mechanosensitive channel
MEGTDRLQSLTGSSMEPLLSRISALIAEYSLSVVGAIAILIIGYILANLVQRWSYHAFERISGFDEALRQFLSTTLRYVVLVFVFVTVLAQFGVQTTSIIAALGAAGLAIGLALQGTLQNVAAGIMLLILRPFRVGEYIEAGSISGTVEEVGLFATQLKTADGVFVLAPNSQLWNSSVVNYTRNTTRRYDLAIGIGYDDDTARAQKLLLQLAREDSRIKTDPAPTTFVSELGDSAVVVTLRYWASTDDFWPTRHDMMEKAKHVFDGNGISIPFPQRDVHLIGQVSGNG